MTDADEDRRLALARTRFWWVSLATALAAWALVIVRSVNRPSDPAIILPWPIIAVAAFLTLRALVAFGRRRSALRPPAPSATSSDPHPKTNP